MTKKYKVEPPELVRQMWESGLNVHADDARGVARVYGPKSQFESELVDRLDCPPSWIKEIEQEQIPASRVKWGAPVEVMDGDDSLWRTRIAAGKASDCYIMCYANGSGYMLEWDHWRIPANMDQEEWKREWLVPENGECPNCGPEDGMDCPKCKGTGEVEVREGSVTMMEFCPRCHGLGNEQDKKTGYIEVCPVCNGTGK